jgi:hypothetical protein
MPVLNVSTAEAAQIIDEQVEAGRTVVEAASDVRGRDAYDNWKRDFTNWVALTQDALRHIYGGETEATSFESAASHTVYIAGGDWPDWLTDYVKDVEDGIGRLQSLTAALRFATGPSGPAPSPASPTIAPADEPGVVFLVHGRNKGVREEVARFLEKAGTHEVVILDEKANRGRTLIEKFEKHAGVARYAVVLLTGDDVGGPADETDRQPRARQNVVFELGFFFGRLGREHVTVLYESDVEKPSDVDGLGYVSLDTNWQQKLVTELTDAGLDFSLDRAYRG